MMHEAQVFKYSSLSKLKLSASVPFAGVQTDKKLQACNAGFSRLSPDRVSGQS